MMKIAKLKEKAFNLIVLLKFLTQKLNSKYYNFVSTTIFRQIFEFMTYSGILTIQKINLKRIAEYVMNHTMSLRHNLTLKFKSLD